MAAAPLHLPGAFPQTPQNAESNNSDTSPSPYDETAHYEENNSITTNDNFIEEQLPFQKVSHNKFGGYYFRKFVQTIMIFVFSACIIGIKMMPSKYMVNHPCHRTNLKGHFWRTNCSLNGKCGRRQL